MYAGTTFRRGSGRIVGVHQKIDRVARRHLKRYIGTHADFPTIYQILHFEGMNGPDGIKRKSPSRDEPWHFIDPTNPKDRQLVTHISDHMANLVQALKVYNNERAAFEAAWLAHAIVDGLTPAHHYPLGDKIEELWGKPHNERLTKADKNIIKGTTRRDTVARNWEYWGAKGVFTAHLAFELGIASMIAPLKFAGAYPVNTTLNEVESIGFTKAFMQTVHRIDSLKMYDEFVRNGWTRSLANQAKQVLIPEIIECVILAWYCAARQAGVVV